MPADQNARRDFLKSVSAGMVTSAAASTAALGLPIGAIAPQSLTKTGHNYNVQMFGAKGDGKSLDSPAINKAIEAAAAAGGATVSFPAGIYLCYSLHLRSNIAIQLSPGTTILAA